MKQMQDFDRFTNTIAENDPVKRAALEGGNLRDYWETAKGYMLKLVHAKEAADRANPKGQPTKMQAPRMSKPRARG